MNKKEVSKILFSLSIIFLVVLTSCASAPTQEVSSVGTAEGTSASDEVQTKTVVLWWWGEEEAPGLEEWLMKTISDFEAQNPNIKIEPVRQTNDGIVPAAQAAMAAQEGPDIQYYWPVTWIQEDIWAGNLVALDDYIPEELDHYPPVFRNHFTYNGKTYAMPFYAAGNPWVYNKNVFRAAGLDPEKPPENWDEFLAAGEKIIAAGYSPIAAGMHDQWYADWPWMEFQMCTLDTTREFFDTYLGLDGTTMEDPKYVELWKRWKILIDDKFFPEEVMSLDLYQGYDLFVQNMAAFATPIQPLAAQWARQLGNENIGIMTTPCWQESGLASTFSTASQALAITSFSKVKTEAAMFLKFLHTPQVMKEMYDMAAAETPDDRFDTNWFTYDIDKTMHDWTFSRPSVCLYDLAPPVLDEWVWPAAGQLYTGESTPEDICKLGETIMKNWRDANPEAINNYNSWADAVIGKK
jgi:raffinose/stachyose/melibiose transport system substrate-binding protein